MSPGSSPSPPYKQPSRLYAAAPVLTPGELFSAAEMVAELKDAGYREAAEGEAVAPGTFRRAGDRVEVRVRRFPTATGPAGGAPVEVTFQGNRVAAVRVADKPAPSITLEPPLLASFYDEELEERRPVTLEELPDQVVKTVLAAEDSGFYIHPGVSPTGIARALWVDLRGGEKQQGGSTITQQLVKNVYLSSRRTFRRKAQEAAIAMMLEVRHGKKAILAAYLNEIYLGRSGSANLIGLGAAARAYFGRDAAELSLAQAATLAGMIQSPAGNSPLEHPDKALARRNWVLQRMVDLHWATPEQVKAAQAEPLGTDPQTVETRPIAPYFASAAEAEAKDRFHVEDLGGKGYLLFSSLRWADQRRAEAAVAQGLAGLDNGKGKHRLQSALISVDPRDGAVYAWVGGRDYEKSQFDRVVQAKRQVGSAFKPVIYAAAITQGTITPAALLKDSPIDVRIGNASWKPQNYDRTFRGWVTARTALEESLNIPTVRVALQVGMPQVVALAKEMGLNEELEPRPSLALGAFEASPFEMSEVYSTLAAGGLRPEVHGLAALVDRDGKTVDGDELPASRRALPAESAYLVTSMLQGVLDRGTAASARAPGGGRPARRQDRHHQRPPRQLVRRLLAGPRHRGLGGLRRQFPDDVLGRPGGAAGLEPVHRRRPPGEGVRRLPAPLRRGGGDDRSDHRPARDPALPLPRHRPLPAIGGADRALRAPLAGRHPDRRHRPRPAADRSRHRPADRPLRDRGAALRDHRRWLADRQPRRGPADHDLPGAGRRAGDAGSARHARGARRGRGRDPDPSGPGSGGGAGRAGEAGSLAGAQRAGGHAPGLRRGARRHPGDRPQTGAGRRAGAGRGTRG